MGRRGALPQKFLGWGPGREFFQKVPPRHISLRRCHGFDEADAAILFAELGFFDFAGSVARDGGEDQFLRETTTRYAVYTTARHFGRLAKRAFMGAV